MKKLFCIAAFVAFAIYTYAQKADRTITASINHVAGKKQSSYLECIGAGRANEGLRADWQQQLAMVQKDMHFKYLRFHGLLNDDMNVFSLINGKPTYNWQYIDKLYDYMLSVHIRPIVELGFMPSAMASGTKTVFWWRGNVTKPKDYAEWDTFIAKLVAHFQDRYGKSEVSKWYFEVWNEPNLSGFFDGTQAEYFELYDHTARAVKSVSAQYRVGGPATAGVAWVPDFLKYCDKNKVPVDFVSTHDYSTKSFLDEFGKSKQKLKANADTIADDLRGVKKQIANSSYPNLEFHLTEWNTSPSSRDYIHDTYQNASYVLHILKKSAPNVTSMSYWTFTDVFEEAGPAVTPFHGGFGLVNLQNIKKPIYYAFKYIAELGDTELKNDNAESIICKQGKNVQALIWDFTFPGSDYTFDQDYFIKEQPPVGQKLIQLNLKDLANGTYSVELYKTGYKVNDPATQYIAWGRPDYISPKQVDKLQQLSNGKPLKTETIIVKNGSYQTRLEVRSNDIYFVKLNFRHS